MKVELLPLLCCPECGSDLQLAAPVYQQSEIESGELRCSSAFHSFAIARFIPRFVPTENYAESFGIQWNRFRKTQLDSHTGVSISRERFFFSTEWSPEELRGKRVLDVGCGAGRFAEVLLSTAANLVAVDYSSAVDACWQNLGPHPRLHVLQADVYRLPFRPREFDYVYCLGVLQHTPDVKRAFVALAEQVATGGKLAVDAYPKLLANILWPKYWLRPLTKRMNPQVLFRLVERVVPWLLPVSAAVSRIPRVGRRLRYLVPVANHAPDYPQLSPGQVREWAVLNTFDMFSPVFDKPQTASRLAAWFREAGLREVRVFRKGHLIGHGVR